MILSLQTAVQIT